MVVAAFPEIRDRKAARWRDLFSAPLAMAAAKQSVVMLRPVGMGPRSYGTGRLMAQDSRWR